MSLNFCNVDSINTRVNKNNDWEGKEDDTGVAGDEPSPFDETAIIGNWNRKMYVDYAVKAS